MPQHKVGKKVGGFRVLKFLISPSFALPFLFLSGVAFAVAASREAHSFGADLNAIADAYRQQEKSLESLYVEYHARSDAIGQPRDIRRYLATLYLVNEKWVFAFKQDMRYAKMDRPGLYDDIVDKMPNGSPKQIRTNPTGEWAFNGKATYTLDGAANTRLHPAGSIVPPDKERTGDSFSQDYMRAAFRELPDSLNIDKSRYKFCVSRLIDHVRCQLHQDDELVNGTRCIGIDWKDKEEIVDAEGVAKSEWRDHSIWCDPKLGFAVRRHNVYFASGDGDRVLAERTDLDDFAEVVKGVWLPKLCTWERYATAQAPSQLKNKLLIRYYYQVSKIHANDVPDELFTPTVPPGTHISDSRYLGKDGDAIQYIMPVDARDLDPMIEALVAGRDFVPSHYSFAKKLSIGALTVLIIVLIGVKVYQIRDRSASRIST